MFLWRRCLKPPCELCISCQQKKTCIFKICSKMDTVNRLRSGRFGCEAAADPTSDSPSSPKTSRGTSLLQRRIKRAVSATVSVPATKCDVCTLMIPSSIFDAHRDIHCAAFGVDSIEKIGRILVIITKLSRYRDLFCLFCFQQDCRFYCLIFFITFF
jgi:hypothetical protein